MSSLTPLHLPPVRPSLRPPPVTSRDLGRGSEVRPAQENEQHEPHRRLVARAEVTALAEQAADDFRRALDISPKHMAVLIAKAAAKGRGEVVELPSLTGLAAQIVHQGKSGEVKLLLMQ